MRAQQSNIYMSFIHPRTVVHASVACVSQQLNFNEPVLYRAPRSKYIMEKQSKLLLLLCYRIFPGKKRKNLNWAAGQTELPVNFLFCCVSNKPDLSIHV